MFAAGPNYNKLKTNLRLAVSRLKLLEKKKAELTQKSRKEIADFISAGKDDRAKIRVEHIIQEDYLIEAMEVVEMYCDLLLARYGLLQQMKQIDPGLAEAISSILWVSPRLQADVPELKVISEQLAFKYGKQYVQACRETAIPTVSEKLMHKMSVQAPSKILVERYLIEISKSHNVPYEPDPEVMKQDECYASDLLIDLGGSSSRPPGGGMPMPPQIETGVPAWPPAAYPQPPQISPVQPFNYPMPKHPVAGPSTLPPPLPSLPPSTSVPYPSVSPSPGKKDYGFHSVPNSANSGVGAGTSLNAFMPDDTVPPYDQVFGPNYRHNQPKAPMPAPRKQSPVFDDLPELPAVPSFSLPTLDSKPSDGSISADQKDDEVDFDHLTKRFEDLKKRK